MSILIEHIKLRRIETNNSREIDKSSENYGPFYLIIINVKKFLFYKVMTLLSILR